MGESLRLFTDKKELLEYIRREINCKLENQHMKFDENNKEKSQKVNINIAKIKRILLDELNYIAKKENLDKKKNLDALLLLNYCCYVVMLETRNIFWEYDYMTFSRRIGELWEPFAKLPFEKPLKNIELVDPISFKDFQLELIKNFNDIIDSLEIDNDKKEKLVDYFNDVWSFVESGHIQLKLDLHFRDGDFNYNIDYKSGFSSNEKGNTNRLLTVGSILKRIDDRNRQIIFVRQEEDDNNNYLKRLKTSGLFEVYCGDEAYDKIYEFTGYNIKQWIRENMDWEKDISDEFYEYLKEHDLIKYLKW